MARRPFPRGGIRTRLPVTIYRRASDEFSPTEIEGLALWLDASSSDLYTTDAGPVVAVASPLDIAGCALWLDGADSSAASMTLDGTAVGTWKDKSGNGRDFTATSTARPTLTASAINSRSALTFNGSANTMTGNAAAQDVIRNLAGYTVFSVLRTASVAAGERFAFGSGLTVLFRLGQQDSRPFIGGRRVAADSLESVTDGSGSLTVSTTFIQTAVVNHSSQSLTGIRNGAAFATDATYMAAGSSENLANAVSVGTQAGGTYGFWNGDIAELIVYPTALTTADRARVEAYLAAKWSISGVHAPATASSDPVGYWGDKSGNGRHAVQATAGNRPTISATAQNGRKNLSFVQKHLLGSFSPELASTDYTVAAVVQTNTGLYNNQRVFSTAASTGNDFGSGRVIPILNNAQVAGGLSAYANANVSPVTGFATYGIFTGVLGGGTVRNSINRGRGQSVAATQTTATAKYGVGTDGHHGGGALFTGSIAELLYYSRALSDSEVSRIETYLSARWGITLAPQVSNADAQDWINRVYANGGSVSSATAAAVDTFCSAIASAGIRDRFYRLGIFAGSNLNAALVPLYRGPSLGGTQYGNATDTNEGGLFVTANYNETGASGGLQGVSASSKRLRTGLAQNAMPTGDLHIAAYEITKSNASSDTSVGARNNSLGQYSELAMGGNTSTALFYNVGTGFATASDSGYTQAGAFLMGVSVSTALTLYKNGSSAATGTVSAAASTSSTFAVFATESESGTGADFTNARIGGYSIGLSMTAAQAAAYNTAMQSFQAALTRNV